MEDIYRIYHNKIGIAFQWKRDISRNCFNKIQIIFRDTGFYLSVDEIKTFSNLLKEATQRGCCKDCKAQHKCRSILLRTPSSKIDLAVSEEELTQISDLIQGTLFQIELDHYLNRLCNN